MRDIWMYRGALDHMVNDHWSYDPILRATEIKNANSFYKELNGLLELFAVGQVG